jgi:hypothetical protein
LKEANQLADRVVAVLGMPKRELTVELVFVAASVTRFREVAGLLEVSDDLRCAALGDSDRGGYVFESHRWVLCDAREHVGVVRDKAPYMVWITRNCIHESLLL